MTVGYTTDILLDALTYSDHAGKNGKLELDDVELAVQAKVNYSFKEAGERDVRFVTRTILAVTRNHT
jgi:hypothetical protein